MNNIPTLHFNKSEVKLRKLKHLIKILGGQLRIQNYFLQVYLGLNCYRIVPCCPRRERHQNEY